MATTYVVTGVDTGIPSLPNDSVIHGLHVGQTFTATLDSGVEAELISAGLIAKSPVSSPVSVAADGSLTAADGRTLPVVTVASGTPTNGQAAVFNGTGNQVVPGTVSGLPSTFVSKTTSGTAAANTFEEVDASGGAVTRTLPSNPAVGTLVAVKKTDASVNAVTIAPQNSGTIDGSATASTTTQYAGLVFEFAGQSAGNDVWFVAASMTTTGPVGPTGPEGQAGGNSFAYTFDTGTSDADPGAGKLRLNNASPASATFIYIDQVNAAGASIAAWLSALASPWGTIKLFDNSTPGTFAIYTLTGVTNAAPYFKLAVTYVAGNGTLDTTAADTIISYSQRGAVGPTGNTGPAGGGQGIYGDGSDGSPTFDGAATILGVAPSSNVYTMNRDWFLASATINSGVQINTNGFRLFCAGTLTGVDSTSMIQWNGNVGSSSNGGLSANNNLSSISDGGGSQAAGTQGGSGTSGAGGAGTTGTLKSWGGVGGTGGTGTGGAGGAAGGLTAFTALYLPLRSLPQAVILQALAANLAPTMFQAGSGGGAGGGDGSVSGGGGGGGGGIVGVYALAFSGAGSIRARGGDGITRTSGNTGGGGGGGGGVVVVVSSSVSAGAISGWTVDANGGAAGSPHGTGTNNATAGSNGLVVLLKN